AEPAKQSPEALWLIWLFAVYTFWALFGQNIEKPRHIAPLLGIVFYLFSFAAMRSRSRALHLLLVLCVGTQLWNVAVLVRSQPVKNRAVQQLADYLSAKDRRFTLYTREEARVLSYLHVRFPVQPIQTFGLFQEQVRVKQEEQALLTDHVLDGFASQKVDT